MSPSAFGRFSSQLSALALVAMVTGGCSSSTDPRDDTTVEAGVGSARVALTSVSSTAVSRATVTVSGPGLLNPVSFDLILNPSTAEWGGTIDNISPGVDRTFVATAYGPNGSLVYRGEQRGVTVQANQTVLVMLFMRDAGIDSDGDGVIDALDNCPTTPNPDQADSSRQNWAVNKARSGYPLIQSDPGWGCCSDPWSLVDGEISAPDWSYGFAYDGGPLNWNGASCGWRQATVDFGAERSVSRFVTYHHGVGHVPTTYKVEVSTGSDWVEVVNKTNNVQCQEIDPRFYDAAAGSTLIPDNCPVIDDLPSVTASKIRYSFYQNCDITDGADWRYLEHGWLREIVAYAPSATSTGDACRTQSASVQIVRGPTEIFPAGQYAHLEGYRYQSEVQWSDVPSGYALTMRLKCNDAEEQEVSGALPIEGSGRSVIDMVHEAHCDESASPVVSTLTAAIHPVGQSLYPWLAADIRSVPVAAAPPRVRITEYPRNIQSNVPYTVRVAWENAAASGFEITGKLKCHDNNIGEQESATVAVNSATGTQDLTFVHTQPCPFDQPSLFGVAMHQASLSASGGWYTYKIPGSEFFTVPAAVYVDAP